MQKVISVGIDIGSKEHRIAAMNPERQIIAEWSIKHRHSEFKQTCHQIKSLAAQHSLPVIIGIEGYNGYAAPFDKYLIVQGFEVKQVNNLTLNRYRQLFGQPFKTDEYDARLIASYLQQPFELKNNNYQENQVKLPQQVNVDIKLLSRHQLDLTKERTRFKNKLHKLLLSYFPEIFDLYSDPFSANCLALFTLGKTPAELGKMKMQRLADVKPKSSKRGMGTLRAQKLKSLLEQTVPALIGGNRVQAIVAADYAQRIYDLNQAINRLDQELASLLGQHPCGKTVLSIPGAGTKTAARIIGETIDIHRFSTLDKYSAYSGVVCLRNDSGKSKRAKTSKQVNHILKDTYMKIAFTSLRTNSASAVYYQRKIKAGHSHFSALKCLAHQICKVAYKLMVSKSMYQEPYYKKAA